LAKSLLRWEPTVSLKDGIKEMMNFYSNEVRVR
jgi:nucleoside-diphosphate-sugar epimerase